MIAKGFYLLLYSIALRLFSLSSLSIINVFKHSGLHGKPETSFISQFGTSTLL